MRRKANLLIPGFLKRLDHYLLINYPSLWATKVHYALFFIFIGYSLMGLHLAMNPIQLHDVPEPWVYFGVLTIPAGLSFLWYAYQVSLFKVEKYTGRWNGVQSLQDQVVYFFIIFLIFIGPFVYFIAHTSLIANQLADKELEEDINALEIGDFFFPTKDGIFEPKNLTPEGEVFFSGNHHFIYTNSSVQGVEVITLEELIKLHSNPIPQRRAKLGMIKQYMDALEKYSGYQVPYTAQEVLATFKAKELLSVNREVREKKPRAYQNLERLLEAKDFIRSMDLFAVIQLYSILIGGAWLMFMVFQQMPLKLFLLALLTGAVVLMATGFLISVFTQIFGINYGQIISLFFYIGLSILFFTIGYHHRVSQRSRAWKAISFGLGVLLTPFIFFAAFSVIGSLGDIFDLLILGLLFTWLLWNLSFQHLFRNLTAQPADN